MTVTQSSVVFKFDKDSVEDLKSKKLLVFKPIDVKLRIILCRVFCFNSTYFPHNTNGATEQLKLDARIIFCLLQSVQGHGC